METRNTIESNAEDKLNRSLEKTLRKSIIQDEVIKQRAIEYFLLKYNDDKIITVDPEKRADINFLKSILIDMAALTPKAKRQFKVNVLQLIDNVIMNET